MSCLTILKESRPLEKVLQLTIGSVDRWGKVSIPTKTVAQAMVNNTLEAPTEKQVNIIEHNQIFQLAGL